MALQTSAMPPQSSEVSLARSRAHAAMLDRFRALLREVPDLRLQKVLRCRRRLAQGRYDRLDVIERTVDRMENDVGVLMRRDPLAELARAPARLTRDR